MLEYGMEFKKFFSMSCAGEFFDIILKIITRNIIPLDSWTAISAD